MYDVLPSFILGFHGCESAVAERIFSGDARLEPSDNDYDWLGHGVYFWENNPGRALDYARMLKRNPRRARIKVETPAVVGAVIDMGLCLNLLDAQFIGMLKASYEDLRAEYERAGAKLPVNHSVGGADDLLLRYLDCAVIENLHAAGAKRGLKPFDSARGVFVEGLPVYPGAGVREFNHIQVCVRNPRSIKGYFRVLPEPS